MYRITRPGRVQIKIPATILFTLWLGAAFVLLVPMTAEAGCFDKREPGMDWSGCKKTNKMLDDSDFTGSRFDNANLILSSFDDSTFKGASLVKADMTRASLVDTLFEDADLTKAAGFRAVFDDVTIKNTIMTKTEFFRASFIEADISGVDWSKSELGRVNFTEAQLERVNFSFSNLSRVAFTEAKLENVNFYGAYTYLTKFEGVDLRQVQNLSQLQLRLACGNAETQLPEDRTMPESWPCTE